MAPFLKGSSSESASKAKTETPTCCTWAEYQEMLKRLQSTCKKIDLLSWRLELERIRDSYGNLLVEKLSPRETWGKPAAWAAASVLLDFLLDSKRLRKEENADDEERSEDEKEKPAHIKKIEEKLSQLRLKHQFLHSRLRRPDFSGMTEADRAAEAERLRDEAIQETRREPDGDRRRLLEAYARVLDFDRKQKGIYYNSFVSLPTFDLAEESPIGPMRFTNMVCQDDEEEVELCDAVNILSINVASSDVGFPIHVYGTVVARDCIDNKRVYLFHRDRQHCQLINSKDEPLTLTGPKRGLVLLEGFAAVHTNDCEPFIYFDRTVTITYYLLGDDVYVEIDLKIKDHQGHDRELSKGLLTISDRRPSFKKCEVGRLSLATRLSTVKVEYAIVVSAVEATVAIEVEEGEFYGIVTAHTTGIKKRLVLYDSQLADEAVGGNGPGAIKMMRPVISVCVDDTLIIIVRAHGGKAVGFEITPRISREEENEFSLGTAKMRLRHAWSMLSPTSFKHLRLYS